MGGWIITKLAAPGSIGMNADENEHTELQRTDKLQILGLIGNWKDNEANRFWTRFNILLLVNSALLAATGLVLRSKQSTSVLVVSKHISISLASLLSGTGFIVCLVWFGVLKISKHYEIRWIKDMDRLRKTDSELAKYVTGYSDESSATESPFAAKATSLAFTIPVIFIILWTLLFVGEIGYKSANQGLQATPESPVVLRDRFNGGAPEP